MATLVMSCSIFNSKDFDLPPKGGDFTALHPNRNFGHYGFSISRPTEWNSPTASVCPTYIIHLLPNLNQNKKSYLFTLHYDLECSETNFFKAHCKFSSIILYCTTTSQIIADEQRFSVQSQMH